MRGVTVRKLDIAVDGASERMIRMARASRLCGALPTESGKELVALAQAVREFALAREIDAATTVLDGIDKLVATHDDGSFVAMVNRHTSAVRKALRPNGRNG